MDGRAKIRIHAPEVVVKDGCARLLAEVDVGNGLQPLWFEFDDCYAKWAVANRSDAFVLLLLEYALWSGKDIVCEQPVSERLLYQLNENLMAQAAAFTKEFSTAQVIAETAPEIVPIVDGVGTGLSCGVDSFYTVYKHLGCGWGQLTHLFFNNVGALTKDPKLSREIFEQKGARFKKVADALGLPLIAINTNILDVLRECPDGVTQPGAIKNAACLFALKRGFRQYWVASGCATGEFHYYFDDNDSYLPMITQSVTLDHLAVLPCGTEVRRIDKLRAIAGYDVVRTNLSVCAGENCGLCSKCTRTQFELYALGMLDGFSQVFDIEWFRHHLADRIAYSMADPTERADGFVRESLDEAKKNSVRIPVGAYLLSWIWYRPLLFVKRHLAASPGARRIYERLRLRERLRLGR